MENSKLVATTGLSDFGFSQKLPPTCNKLYQPNNPERTHPLQKLKRGAFHVSGKFCKAGEFRESLLTSSFKQGDNLQRNNECYLRKWLNLLCKSRLILQLNHENVHKEAKQTRLIRWKWWVFGCRRMWFLFVWFDSLRPGEQFFSYVGTGLPEFNQY